MINARGKSWLSTILFCTALWASTRVSFALIGVYAARFNEQPAHWVGMWTQWDANFYISIAADGYQPPVVVTGLENGQSNINFFPLMPLLIAAVHIVVHPIRLAGLIAANACLLAATILLHRLALRRLDRSGADWAVLSLMLLPGSFALSGPMSEAPFLLFSIAAALLAERHGRAAALCSGALTIARWTGVLQGMGMALDWLVDRVRGRDASYAQLLSICLVPLPLLAFLIYMYYLTDDVLAPLHSNFAFWHQRFGWPLQSLFLFLHATAPELQMQSAIALLLITLTACQAKVFSVGELLFALLSVISFSSSVSASPSLVRYTIGLYPIHLAMGLLCSQYAAIRLVLLCLTIVGSALAVFWFAGNAAYV